MVPRAARCWLPHSVHQANQTRQVIIDQCIAQAFRPVKGSIRVKCILQTQRQAGGDIPDQVGRAVSTGKQTHGCQRAEQRACRVSVQ